MRSLFKTLKGKGTDHVDVHQLKILNSYTVCKNGFLSSLIQLWVVCPLFVEGAKSWDILVNRTRQTVC